MNKIGFMQGRLSEVINNRIQSFPKETWQDEFLIAERCDFKLVEWTLDQEDLYKNPTIKLTNIMEHNQSLNMLISKILISMDNVYKNYKNIIGSELEIIDIPLNTPSIYIGEDLAIKLNLNPGDIVDIISFKQINIFVIYYRSTFS